MSLYCFSVLSLEIQNDSDQTLMIKNKRTNNDFVSFNPTGDQTVSINGGKADLTVGNGYSPNYT